MASAVLDASAVLAHMLSEPGSQAVGELAADGLLSAVNMSEVIAKLLERNLTLAQVDEIFYRYGFEVVPFDEELARQAAALRVATRRLGLSLGDRACLALAQREGLPAVTADKQWAKLKLGIDIKVVR